MTEIEYIPTKWEKFREFWFKRLFPEEIIELSNDFYMKGFTKGYRVGREHQKADDLRLAKDMYNINL